MTTLLRASDWGMRWARDPVTQVMPVPEMYVHQTAGRDPVEKYPSGDDDPGAAFRALNEYAIVGKGYSAVDYSMLVHTGPSFRTTIGEARGEWMPAATKDRNAISKAVCLLGWFGPPDPRYPWTTEHSRVPFDSELLAIAESVVWMMGRGWVRRDARILGHRDNPSHPNATACPGDYLYAKLPVIRSMVNALLNPVTPEPIGDDVITYAEIRDLWVAPNTADVGDGGASDRWLAVMIAKVGAIADVQKANGLVVTGRYDAATAATYARLLGEMKLRAGA